VIWAWSGEAQAAAAAARTVRNALGDFKLEVFTSDMSGNMSKVPMILRQRPSNKSKKFFILYVTFL